MSNRKTPTEFDIYNRSLLAVLAERGWTQKKLAAHFKCCKHTISRELAAMASKRKLGEGAE